MKLTIRITYNKFVIGIEDIDYRRIEQLSVKMYNVMNEANNTNLFRKNKYKQMIPLSDSWSQNDLTCTQIRERRPENDK